MFLPFLTFAVLGGFLGGSLASFLGVVSSRRGTGEGIGGRSHCVCGRQLTWWQMIPVFGYLISGGKDRSCGSRIPPVYFLTEALSFVTGFLTGWTGLGYALMRGELAPFVAAGVALLAALLITFIATGQRGENTRHAS